MQAGQQLSETCDHQYQYNKTFDKNPESSENPETCLTHPALPYKGCKIEIKEY